MNHPSLPLELTDLIANTVLSTYAALPPKGKPRARSNGVLEWTVLAGFCCFDEVNMGGWNVECVSLGTGLKVLPHAKLPPHGDVLHDSHAEVIARRGLMLWTYDQLQYATTGQPSRFQRTEGGWKLRDGLKLGLYVSTLPCGDASTYSLSLAAPPSPILLPSASTATPVERLASSLIATSLGIQTSRSPLSHTLDSSLPSADLPLVHRGRVAYSSFSSLRTKPGRLDSPPTISHSCSDKLAMWTAVGVQGALLAALGVERVEIEALVVGGVPIEQRQRVREEVSRAVGGRLGEWKCEDKRVRTPAVAFTDSTFEAARDAVAQSAGVSETEVLSCPGSISFVASQGVEVLVNGIRQGAKTKRKPGEALGDKSRSRICKLALYTRYQALLFASSSYPDPARSHLGLSTARSTYNEAKGTATDYQQAKRALTKREGPLHGWLVSGARWESFEVDGRLREEIAEMGQKEEGVEGMSSVEEHKKI